MCCVNILSFIGEYWELIYEILAFTWARTQAIGACGKIQLLYIPRKLCIVIWYVYSFVLRYCPNILGHQYVYTLTKHGSTMKFGEKINSKRLKTASNQLTDTSWMTSWSSCTFDLNRNRTTDSLRHCHPTTLIFYSTRLFVLAYIDYYPTVPLPSSVRDLDFVVYIDGRTYVVQYKACPSELYTKDEGKSRETLLTPPLSISKRLINIHDT